MKKIVSICDVKQDLIRKDWYSGHYYSTIVEVSETDSECIYVVKFPFDAGLGCVDEDTVNQHLEELGGDIITIVNCNQ